MPEYNMKDVTEHIIVCKPAAPNLRDYIKDGGI